MISVRVIDYGSAEYALELKLRSQVLREPLGLQLTKKDLSQDQSNIHLAAFSGDRLVGCLLLKPEPSACAKMRQVAIDPGFQGQGIGKMLVHHCEQVARESKFAEIVLNARESAVPFYLSLGYQVEGESFEEVGIPHFKMRKKISGGA